MLAIRSLFSALAALVAVATLTLQTTLSGASFVPERLLGAHHMVAFAWSTTDQAQFDEEARRWKEAGFDFVILHMDAYDSGYPAQLRSYYDAAAKVGIKCIPSWSWFYWATFENENGILDPEYPGRLWLPQIVRDTRDHPAQFKVDGQPVYSGYNFPWYSQEVLEAAGEWPVKFWPHMYYHDPEVGNTVHSTNDPDRIRAMYDTFPWLSGLCNFSGDMGSAAIRDLNRVLTEVSRERGKWSMAGVTPFYGSHNLQDLGGFRGLADQWAEILRDKPNAVWWVTTNDWNELSYVADLPESPVWTNHWNEYHMADPLDHSGFRKFAEPFVAAYKAGLTEPVITRDRIFICYQLHPKDVEPIAGSPDHMYGGRTWRSQLPDRIFVSAHLATPARIQIDGQLSEEFPAGVAHFDVPLAVGDAPSVAIIRNGETVKTGSAPLPITNSPEIGAWNYLAVELAESDEPIDPPIEPIPDPMPASYETYVWPEATEVVEVTDFYFTWGREDVSGEVTWTPADFPGARVKNITNGGQASRITLSDDFQAGASILLNAQFWSAGKSVVFAAADGTTIKYITAEGSEAAANTNAAGEIWIYLERGEDGWTFEWAGAGRKEYHDDVFAISGGTHVQENGYTKPARYSSYVRGGYSVRFHSNAQRVYLYLHLNATQFRVVANGVTTHEARDDHSRPQGTWGVFPIDFGSRGDRDIEIFFDNDTPFMGAVVPPSLGKITPWAGAPWVASMALIGDSITEGGTRGYAWSAAHLLNVDAIVSPMGSTGYVDPGFISGYPHDFHTRLEDDVLKHDPDIVVVSGGINDQSHPADDQNDPEEFASAVRSLFERVEERLPNAIKVALSPFWPNQAHAPVNIEYTDIVSSIASERGWHFIDFRYIPNDKTEEFITGDGVHPTAEGWSFLGERLAQDLAPILGAEIDPRPTPEPTPDPDPEPEPDPDPTPEPPPAASDRWPWEGTAQTIPGRIEAEHFDEGGADIAYHDTTPQNEGGAVRSDGVDLEAHPDGHSIGWFRPGEWTAYTVEVTHAGRYDASVRVASLETGGRIKLTLDGIAITEPIQIPDTGAWFNWIEHSVEIDLPAGTHELRLVGIDSDNPYGNAVGNVDWIEFEALEIPVPSPGTGDDTPNDTTIIEQVGFDGTVLSGALTWESNSPASRYEIWQGFGDDFRHARKIGETTNHTFSFDDDQLAAGAHVWILGFEGDELLEVGESALVDATKPVPVIENLSTRMSLRPGVPLVSGFVLEGAERRRVLIRAIGPTLAEFGVSDFADAPQIVLAKPQNPAWTMTVAPGWNSPELRDTVLDAFATAGAFSLKPDSQDAVALVDLDPGVYTATVTDSSPAAGGTVLVEFYSLAGDGGAPANLINISSRGFVGTGADIFVAGIVITGEQRRQVVVRGSGPALAGFGVPDTVENPSLAIYSSTNPETPVATNDDWDSDPSKRAVLESAFSTVGAFLFESGSRDAGLLINLAPGAYTIHLAAEGGATGTGMIEVYELK